MAHRSFHPDLLRLDYEKEADRIGAFLREKILRGYRKKGVVVGLSGGIDSSVVAGLSVRALGPERVFGLLMPERDSAGETLALSRGLAEHLGIQYAHEDISGILEATGCYRRRDEAIRRAVPDYGPGCKSKIVLPPSVEEAFRVFKVVVQYPDGRTTETRLDLEAYLGVVAATNFKQRTRKMLGVLYHADRLNYAASGTPNRLEYDQGFFVKLGDGAADIKPIAHLYKTQVYRMADFLKLPDAIRSRPPTTDTYSLPQSQEEFYFLAALRQDGPCFVRQEQRLHAGGDRSGHRPDRRTGGAGVSRHRSQTPGCALSPCGPAVDRGNSFRAGNIAARFSAPLTLNSTGRIRFAPSAGGAIPLASLN